MIKNRIVSPSLTKRRDHSPQTINATITYIHYPLTLESHRGKQSHVTRDHIWNVILIATSHNSSGSRAISIRQGTTTALCPARIPGSLKHNWPYFAQPNHIFSTTIGPPLNPLRPCDTSKYAILSSPSCQGNSVDSLLDFGVVGAGDGFLTIRPTGTLHNWRSPYEADAGNYQEGPAGTI
jgi:hypothetical protein